MIPGLGVASTAALPAAHGTTFALPVLRLELATEQLRQLDHCPVILDLKERRHGELSEEDTDSATLAPAVFGSQAEAAD